MGVGDMDPVPKQAVMPGPDVRLPGEYTNVWLEGWYRWQFYKHADKPFDLYVDPYRSINPTGDEVIFDVGCGTAEGLERIRDLGHRGLLVGIDPNPRGFKRGIQGIELRVKQAEELDTTEEADIVMAVRSAYHWNNLTKGLRSCAEALRPDGYFVPTSTGINNKKLVRQIGTGVGRRLKSTPPPRYTAPFKPKVAESVLPLLYESVEKIPWRSTATFTEEDLGPFGDFYLSIFSWKSEFRPRPKVEDLREAFEQEVAEHEGIQTQLRETGKFTDTVEQIVYICHKVKDLSKLVI